jgi:hypothetical protein
MNAKRWTVCLLRGHKWNRIDQDDSGHFIRCRTCWFTSTEGIGIVKSRSATSSTQIGGASPAHAARSRCAVAR